jgi:hypothetical protein
VTSGRSLVQARGRARHRDSRFIVMYYTPSQGQEHFEKSKKKEANMNAVIAKLVKDPNRTIPKIKKSSQAPSWAAPFLAKYYLILGKENQPNRGPQDYFKPLLNEVAQKQGVKFASEFVQISQTPSLWHGIIKWGTDVFEGILSCLGEVLMNTEKGTKKRDAEEAASKLALQHILGIQTD